MASRLELHEILCEILGTRNVYFQPPENIKLEIPCIVYSLSSLETTKANNETYLTDSKYAVNYISRDCDNDMCTMFLKLPYTSFNRRYVKDNLYYDVYDIYY